MFMRGRAVEWMTESRNDLRRDTGVAGSSSNWACCARGSRSVGSSSKSLSCVILLELSSLSRIGGGKMGWTLNRARCRGWYAGVGVKVTDGAGEDMGTVMGPGELRALTVVGVPKVGPGVPSEENVGSVSSSDGGSGFPSGP